MILKTKTNKEYRAGGSLMYQDTVATLAPLFSHLYPNRRVSSDGVSWVRIGLQAKYWKNGQIHWKLNYDKFGTLIKEDNTSRREDGTAIVY